MKKFPIIFVALVALITAIPPVYAGTANSSLNISANLVPSCSVATGSDIIFGDVAVNLGATATGSINVTCSSTLNFTLAMNGGLHYTPGVARGLAKEGSTQLLYYDIYRTTGLIYGDIGFGDTVPYPPLTLTSIVPMRTVTVTGVIPGGQSAEAGAYTDIVLVTLGW